MAPALRLTVDECLALQDDLIDAYKQEDVQKKMVEIAELVKQGRESEALDEKSKYLLEVQKPVMPKHGFEASAAGVQEAMMAFTPDEVNRDPAVFKRNNRMELLLAGGLPLDSYFTSWAMIQLRNLGIYRLLPQQRFPMIDTTDPKRIDFGRVEQVLKKGVLDSEETEQLVAACTKTNDIAKASQLLGTRRVGASAKAMVVNAGYTGLGTKGAVNLAKALGQDMEQFELDIAGNNIGLEGARALAAKIPAGAKIFKLNIANNMIGLEGVKTIMSSLPKGVEVLGLGFAGMKMGEEGARAIAAGMPQSVKELYLDIYGNMVGDEGVVAISRSLPKTIEYLNIVMLSNNLSRRGLNVIDRQIDDPLNQYHLPLLKTGNYKKTAELELYELKEQEDGHVVRQLDFRMNF